VNTPARKQSSGPLGEAQVDPGFNGGSHLAKQDNRKRPTTPCPWRQVVACISWELSSFISGPDREPLCSWARVVSSHTWMRRQMGGCMSRNVTFN
jgi:hypothetical protein